MVIIRPILPRSHLCMRISFIRGPRIRLRRVTGKNGALDSCTLGNGHIKVNALVGLLLVEEVENKFEDTGQFHGRSTGRSQSRGGALSTSSSVLQKRS